MGVAMTKLSPLSHSHLVINAHIGTFFVLFISIMKSQMHLSDFVIASFNKGTLYMGLLIGFLYSNWVYCRNTVLVCPAISIYH